MQFYLFNIRPELHHQKWRLRVTLPVNRRNMHVLFPFSGIQFEERWHDNKQTCMKTGAYKLYSGVFWILTPNVIKIDPYDFELYRFKVGAFLRHGEI